MSDEENIINLHTPKRAKASQSTRHGPTEKQSNFIHLVVWQGMSLTEAYFSSYDAQKMSVNAVQKEAATLWGNPKLTPYIEREQEERRNRDRKSADYMNTKIREVALSIAESPQNSPKDRLAACKLMGELTDVGAFTKQVSVDLTQEMSDEDLQNEIKALISKAG